MLQDPGTLAFLLLFLGLLFGLLSGWLIAKLYFANKFLPKNEIEGTYVHVGIYQALQQQADLCQDNLVEKEIAIRELTGSLKAYEQKIQHLEENLEQQKWEAAEWHRKSRLEFENIANRLLEEKSRKFADHNLTQLTNILAPLKEKIKTFEEGIQKRYIDESKDRVSLQKEIEHLRELNTQLSQDANNLASALKGDSKVQGDWGELQLKLLLEKSGLVKDLHFQTQVSFKDADGKQKRPDFIIHLPAEKHLVIDSKVSLRAYEQFYNSQDEEEKRQLLKAHVTSIRQHIKSLGSKNYQHLYQINAPDYLLLFIPIEQAFSLAVQEDNRLFTEALDQNIVLVTTSTLLATMRTVAHIWNQEKQKNSVLEIARQSGLLYDKFCSFVEDLQDIGVKLEQANKAHRKAMNKLTDAKRKGNSLIGRAEKIKSLGAKASKNLPKNLLEKIDDELE